MGSCSLYTPARPAAPAPGLLRPPDGRGGRGWRVGGSAVTRLSCGLRNAAPLARPLARAAFAYSLKVEKKGSLPRPAAAASLLPPPSLPPSLSSSPSFARPQWPPPSLARSLARRLVLPPSSLPSPSVVVVGDGLRVRFVPRPPLARSLPRARARPPPARPPVHSLAHSSPAAARRPAEQTRGVRSFVRSFEGGRRQRSHDGVSLTVDVFS